MFIKFSVCFFFLRHSPFELYELNPQNPDHINFLQIRGIDVRVSDGQIHLTQIAGKALTTDLAVDGQKIMEEIMRLAQQQGPINGIKESIYI